MGEFIGTDGWDFVFFGKMSCVDLMDSAVDDYGIIFEVFLRIK